MSEQPAPPPSPQPQQQMAIELPSNLEAIYSNFVLITHSPSEVIMDFARALPNIPTVKVSARILMTPLNAKLLLRALADNLRKYETQFGEIAIPSNLADHFFKPSGKE
ncbi:MAG: DUF3467 domain-containing protein [Anaerolineales bacterium]